MTHDFRIEGGAASGDCSQSAKQSVNIQNAVLQQISEPLGTTIQQLGGAVGLNGLRQQQDDEI